MNIENYNQKEGHHQEHICCDLKDLVKKRQEYGSILNNCKCKYLKKILLEEKRCMYVDKS